MPSLTSAVATMSSVYDVKPLTSGKGAHQVARDPVVPGPRVEREVEPRHVACWGHDGLVLALGIPIPSISLLGLFSHFWWATRRA